MDLSIVIVNWKSAAFLADCLTSINAAPLRVSCEIVVIDNASFDGCNRMLSECFPAVRFVQSKHNEGFAAANNVAFSRSTGDVVCFLNPDTKVRAGALQTLYDALISIPDAGAVGALLLNGDGTPQTSCVLPFPTILNQALDIEWLRQRLPKAKLFGAAAIFSTSPRPQAVESISGACIMMRRKTFLDVGMFSTEYFMYAEDIDLCRKIKMGGNKVYLINTAQIVHFGGGSSVKQKDRRFSALLMRESNYRLVRKFRGRGYAAVYRAAVICAALLRMAGLLLVLAPAGAIGRGRVALDILDRWWHLFCWGVGCWRVPQSFTARTANS